MQKWRANQRVDPCVMVRFEQPVEKVERIGDDRHRTERNAPGNVVRACRSRGFGIVRTQNRVELPNDSIVRFDEVGNRDAYRARSLRLHERGSCPMDCRTQFLVRVVARCGDHARVQSASGFEALNRRARRSVRVEHPIQTRRHHVEAEQQQRFRGQASFAHGDFDSCRYFGFRGPTPLPCRSNVVLRPIAKQTMVLVVVELREQRGRVPNRASRATRRRCADRDRRSRSPACPACARATRDAEPPRSAACERRPRPEPRSARAGNRRAWRRALARDDRNDFDCVARRRRSMPWPTVRWRSRPGRGCSTAAVRRRA